MLATNNTTLFTNNTSSSYDPYSNIYSYGNYYNWYSATAGHGTYDKSSGNTAGDICPAGWHLPTGGNASAEFGVLDIALGGTGSTQSGVYVSNWWRNYPNNFVYSGDVSGSSIYNRGSGGTYMSASAYNNYHRYGLFFNNGNDYPGTSVSNKFNGLMARCVAGV